MPEENKNNLFPGFNASRTKVPVDLGIRIISSFIWSLYFNRSINFTFNKSWQVNTNFLLIQNTHLTFTKFTLTPS